MSALRFVVSLPTDLPWANVGSLPNSLNSNLEVKIGRDMQEVEAGAGAKLLSLLNKAVVGQPPYPNVAGARGDAYATRHQLSAGDQGYPPGHPASRALAMHLQQQGAGRGGGMAQVRVPTQARCTDVLDNLAQADSLSLPLALAPCCLTSTCCIPPWKYIAVDF